jgi:CheY-like chemotaxis protein
MDQKPEKTSNILIVDKDPAAIEVFKNMLSNKGFEVGTARTGAEAEDFMKNQKYDVIITDYNMPDIDGYKLTNTVKTFYRNYKVMMVSNDAKKQELLLKRGARETFDQPLNMDDFIKELCSLIEDRRHSKRFHRGHEMADQDIYCTIRDRDDNRTYEGTILNISIDGALVVLKTPIPKSPHINLEFSLSRESRVTCKITGWVVRIIVEKANEYQAAICFDENQNLNMLEYFAPAINFLKK